MKTLKSLPALLMTMLLTLLLSACQTLDISDNRPTDTKTIAKSDALWQQHLAALKQIRQYGSQGQIGYISSKERFSSRFEWQYVNPKNYTLKLFSTISPTSLTMQMHNAGITVSDNKGNRRSEADAKMLVREIVGMDVPLDYLADWLKGQPNAQADYQVGENHYLASFSYNLDGSIWTADYLNYHTELSPALPRDILLKNNNQTLKIRVDNWKL
ncbi:lipoprotein insertase outer membrane protein LolB [Pasteurellaceae bacterium LIM206]|nr:lipoprotein insertase outer membrane protein LolB [Pasteurellaceae bacterium LIM206]